MRDYYTEFVSSVSRNPPENSVSKVSEAPSDTFDTSFRSQFVELSPEIQALNPDPKDVSEPTLHEPVGSPVPVVPQLHKGEYREAFGSHNVLGQRVLSRLIEANDERGNAGKPFLNLGQPTCRAYEAEQRLVEAVILATGHSEELSSVQGAIDEYIETHSWDRWNDGPWTGDEVPLYYLKLGFTDGTTDAQSCNEIQAHIFAAIAVLRDPMVELSIARL